MIINTPIDKSKDLEAKILNKVYPVGSIYTSVNSTNPSTLFGGTWERFGNGKVLVGVDENDTNFNTVEKTGGEKTHTLTVDEMPSHSHTTYLNSSTSEGNYNKHYMRGADYSTSETYTSSSVGGNTAHNNLQPYITVYMWKRVA